MLPIRDHNPSNRTPYVTYALITANVVIFIVNFSMMGDAVAMASFYNDWSTVPIFVTSGEQMHTVVTSMFLHGSILHLVFNMLFLWIFGDNLEDAFGHFWFLGFYLLCGVAAGMAYVLVNPYSIIPMIGASGAIAGVMGGYLLLFPKARIDVLFFLFIFFKKVSIPAWAVLIFWFFLQIINGLAVGQTGEGGVAYEAHIGGFVAGLVLTLRYWAKRNGPKYWKENNGKPPHPEAKYRDISSPIPRAGRRRSGSEDISNTVWRRRR